MREVRPDSAPGRLAAGPIRRWVVGKPRLAASSIPETTKSGPVAFPSTQLLYRVGVLLRASLVVGGMVTFAAVASWAILIATVISMPSVEGKTYVVQRAAWPEGQVPSNSTVFALSNPVDRSIAGRFALSTEGDSKASVVLVLGGPNVEVATNTDGVIVIDGKLTKFKTNTPIALHNASGNYIALCVEGPCGKPGTPIEVPIEHTLGKVLGSAKFIGLAPTPALTVPGEQ